jgi:hypothetical protein
MIQSSMGAHQLDVRYGDRNTLPYYNGILNSALLSDADVVAAICAGTVMSLTTGGLLVPGILATAAADGGVQPFYAWSGLDANNYPDVRRTAGMPGFLDKPVPAPGGYPAGTNGFPFHGVPLSAGLVGGFATIAHTFAGELSTTEFNTAVAYPVGAALTCVAADAAATPAIKQTRGKLMPVAAATDTIVGYVAPAGKFLNPQGYSVLAFYPAFVKGTTVPANF